MCSLSEKVNRSIDMLKLFEPVDDSYFICYSGGKDSDCLRILADLANVRYELHYSLTTVDAPESVQYVKSIPNIHIDKARYSDGSHLTMWNLIPNKKMPPTRRTRYCCEMLKEWNGKGRLKVTGVRSSESLGRSLNSGDVNIISRPKSVQKFLDRNEIAYDINKNGGIILNYDNSDSRRAVEHCFRTSSTLINPILNWTDRDVWDFLSHYNCKSNPLYQCGFDRVGCIGCPLSNSYNMIRELNLYPKIKANYIRAFDRMFIERKNNNLPTDWTCGEEVLYWWTQQDYFQLTFDGLEVL